MPKSRTWSVLFQWLHLVGASFAGGGMIMLLVAYLPALGSGVIDAETAGRFHAVFFSKARYVFWVALLLLASSGLYLAIVESGLQSVGDLLSTKYGKVLLVKVACAKVVAILALLMTLPLQVLAGIQAHTPKLLPVAFVFAGTTALLGAYLRRMER